MYTDRLHELLDTSRTDPADPPPVIALPADLAALLCPEALRGATNWASWSRGVDLFRCAPATQPALAAGQVVGTVRGSGTTSYAATLAVGHYKTNERTFLTGSCSCPLGRAGKASLCKHAIALGLATLGYTPVPAPPTPGSQAELGAAAVLGLLAKLPAGELVALITALTSTDRPVVLLSCAKAVSGLHEGGTLAGCQAVLDAAAQSEASCTKAGGRYCNTDFVDAASFCLDLAATAGAATRGQVAELVLNELETAHHHCLVCRHCWTLDGVVAAASTMHQRACADKAVGSDVFAAFLIRWSHGEHEILQTVDDWFPLADPQVVAELSATQAQAAVRWEQLTGAPVPRAAGAAASLQAQCEAAGSRVHHLGDLLARVILVSR